jgi:hypothetical protein
VTRHVFESFSQAQSFSRSAGLSADSHHLQPRKAVLDQLLRHSTSTIMLLIRTLGVGQPLVADHGHEISQPLTASVGARRWTT